MKSTFCEKTPDWYIGMIHDIAFWALSKAYVSKSRNITKHRRNMVYSAFESWSFIFLNFEKTFVIRTHPEELHVVKCAPNVRIATHFYPLLPSLPTTDYHHLLILPPPLLPSSIPPPQVLENWWWWCVSLPPLLHWNHHYTTPRHYHTLFKNVLHWKLIIMMMAPPPPPHNW